MHLTQKKLDDLTFEINGAMIEVHRQMGPGLNESVYHKCLKHEFKLRGINFKSEVIIPIKYKDMEEEIDFKCDFIIENAIIVELKAVSEILDIHIAQILNYMNLAKLPKGILVNFNVEVLMRDGHQTFVNKFFATLP
jgi:GxxExxY protein